MASDYARLAPLVRLRDAAHLLHHQAQQGHSSGRLPQDAPALGRIKACRDAYQRQLEQLARTLGIGDQTPYLKPPSPGFSYLRSIS